MGLHDLLGDSLTLFCTCYSEMFVFCRYQSGDGHQLVRHCEYSPGTGHDEVLEGKAYHTEEAGRSSTHCDVITKRRHRSPTFLSRDACCWNTGFPRHVDADLAYTRRTHHVAPPYLFLSVLFFFFSFYLVIYSSLFVVRRSFIYSDSLYRAGSCTGNVLHSCRGGALFEYGPIHRSS
jgi:hypothetical protein